MPLPSLFVSHGSPMLALTDTPARRFLQTLGRDLPRPTAVVVVSAHFETDQPAIVADERPAMIYDFSGFPRPLYEIVYPAPGEPDVAREVADLVTDAGLPVRLVPRRGFDHGAWVPLMLMYPEADLPVVQLSVQPGRDERHHLALGHAIARLREEDILVLGTGSMTHNLRDAFGRGERPEVDAPPRDWVEDFAGWIAAKAEEGAVDDLVAYRDNAPAGAHAHPTDEHFLPFFVAMGAGGEGVRGRRIHRSVEYGSLAMDVYRFE